MERDPLARSRSQAPTPPASRSSQLSRPPPGIVGLLTGVTSEQSAELRDLLHSRLYGVLAILTALVLIATVRVVLFTNLIARMALRDKLVALVATLNVIGLFLSVRKGRHISIAALRRIELITVLSWLGGNGYFTYNYLTHGAILPFAAGQGVAASLQEHFWVLYPDGSVQVQAGFQALTGFVVIRWCLGAVLYGVVIPNTARRCVLMMLLIMTGYLTSTLLAARQSPALLSQIGLSLSLGLPLLASFSAIGVYGCHKLSALRDQVFAARQIGQYHLERRLGSGGMGEVYLARHRMLRRPCALKLIRPDQASSQTNVTRFEREVQAMAKLTHPNTVEIYDYGRADDGTFYYVMEYLPGTSLESLVKHHGPLSGGRAVYFMQQACRALSEAHSAGLIHRDIKPSNIFVCERGGEFDRIKLLDFGLVQVKGMQEPAPAELQSSSGMSSRDVKLTQVGHILGTPAYLSPEQVIGEAADPRTDIYSLGAVAYYLLTGQPPFVRAASADLYLAHISEAPHPPSELQRGVPGDLEAIVLRCLSKEPASRYASTQELEEALTRCACKDEWSATAAATWWRSHSQSAEPAAPEPEQPAAASAGAATQTSDVAQLAK